MAKRHFYHALDNGKRAAKGKLALLVPEQAVRPYRFDRIYGGWWAPVLRSDAWETVRRSATRYIEHLRGTA
jgi:hypothetical protein